MKPKCGVKDMEELGIHAKCFIWLKAEPLKEKEMATTLAFLPENLKDTEAWSGYSPWVVKIRHD